MDFYGQHSYDKESESEAMNVLVMKLIDVEQQMWDLKPMILAREQAGHLISPSLKEEFNNLPQSLQQAWDEAATFPSYHKIVKRYEFSDDFSSAEDDEEETEENVKEEDDAPFEAPLLYKELQPYVPPITLLSQPEQEDVTTIPYYEMEEKVKEVKDVPFEEPLLYKELKPYVPPITLSSQSKQEDVVTFPLKGEEVEKKETEEKVKVAEDVPFEALLLYKELNLMFLLLLFRAAYTKATGISGFLNLFHHTL
ncbi:hypothetical protein QYF36_017221 [Acer negundo]|nr:hypothetical protein QYF36_017221 [Acer negundo]